MDAVNKAPRAGGRKRRTECVRGERVWVQATVPDGAPPRPLKPAAGPSPEFYRES